MLSNILVELPWALVSAVALFLTWYYPAGFYKNAQVTDTVHERGGLMFLFVVMYLLFTSTFGYLCVAAIETAETAGNIANLAFIMCLIFCGYVHHPSAHRGLASNSLETDK
jgi:ATP-binding cassette subfamily G (WHITE) protein 2 (PDR)